MRAVLSPKELAEAIGVSESSLKRWADEGKVRVTRTAGGHRRIAFSEAIRFIRETQSPVVRPDILGLSDVANVMTQGQLGELGDPEATLSEAMQAGDVATARGLMVAWYLEGHSVPALLDGPVRSAMHRVGALWEHDDRGIFVEHRATDICVEALNHLRWLLPRPSETAPLAMGGAAEHDPYIIPSLMCSIVLADLGFRATNLGAHTPVTTLKNAVREYGARLVWYSYSSPIERRETHRQIEHLAADVAEAGSTLVVGGRQIDATDRFNAPNVHIMQTMGEMAAFARGLLSNVTAAAPGAADAPGGSP